MATKLPVILDNRDGNTVLNALQRLLPSLQKMDVATGVFEIGSLLQLEGLWQQVPAIRILIQCISAAWCIERFRFQILQRMMATLNILRV